jgi:hypothetical protein
MYKQFLETVLPSQGNYCIFTIAADVKKQKTIEGADLEKTYELIEDYKAKRLPTFTLRSHRSMALPARRTKVSTSNRSFLISM